MDGLHFIYFVDPMCSWCYGFSPVVAAMRQRYGDILPIRPVLGGLRPGTTEPMPDSARRNLVHHWEEIAKIAGVSFDAGWADREGFIYDTDPAARAVVLARRTSDEAALDLLAAIHLAFYAEGRDVTDYGVLADVAAGLGFDRDAFAAELETEALKTETWRDYAISQRAGATGFPTLIVGPNTDNTYALVTRGYQGPDAILGAIDHWLAGVRPAA